MKPLEQYLDDFENYNSSLTKLEEDFLHLKKVKTIISILALCDDLKKEVLPDFISGKVKIQFYKFSKPLPTFNFYFDPMAQLHEDKNISLIYTKLSDIFIEHLIKKDNTGHFRENKIIYFKISIDGIDELKKELMGSDLYLEYFKAKMEIKLPSKPQISKSKI